MPIYNTFHHVAQTKGVELLKEWIGRRVRVLEMNTGDHPHNDRAGVLMNVEGNLIKVNVDKQASPYKIANPYEVIFNTSSNAFIHITLDKES